MKKTILLNLLFFGFSLISLSQILTIKDKDGNDVTNSSYTFAGTKDSDWEASFTVETQSGDTNIRAIALRRYETKVCDNSQNYFCWTTCYGAVNAGIKPVWEDGPINIYPDSIFNEFHAYYKENGTGADATFKYVLFDTLTNDSVSLNITFDAGQPECTANSINEELLKEIEVYPNPTNQSISLKNINGLNLDKIEIINILGESVYSSNKLSVSHNVSRLDKGIYIVKLYKNQEVVYIEKLLKN